MRRFRGRDLREEMEFHREALRAEGASPRAFGNDLLLRERSREVWGWLWLETLGRNLRFALRQLRRTPGFTAVAVVTLALTIGATTAVFSVVNATLLRPLPVPHPDQLSLLYWVSRHAPDDLDLMGTNAGLPGGDVSHGHTTGGTHFYSIAYPDYLAVRKPAARVASSIFGFAQIGLSIADRTGVYAEPASLVTDEYFSGLGVAAERGRVLLPTDFAAGAPLVAVLSDSLWKQRYGASAAIIGRTITVNRHPAVVVGIAPAAFLGLDPAQPDRLWLPAAAGNGLSAWDYQPAHGTPYAATDYWWLQVMARRRAGVSEAQLLAALAPTFNADSAGDVRTMLHSGDEAPQLRVTAGARGIDDLGAYYHATLAILFSGVGLLLLLASVNLAALLLARSGARRREIGVRLALGAGRGKLVAQLLTESVLLACMGGALGLGLSGPAARLLSEWLATNTAQTLTPRLDGQVAAFALGVALLTGVLFGLAPALRSTRLDLAHAMKRDIAPRQRLRSDKGLAMAQTALSVLLLAAAGLLVRTWMHLVREPLGFDPAGVVTFNLDASNAGHSAATLPGFYLEAQRRFAALPAVVSVSASQHALLSGNLGGDEIRLPASSAPTQEHDALRNGLGPDFFTTMRIPMLQGREIDERDVRDARPVCVISQTAARVWFGGRNAIGQQVVRSDSSTASTTFTVIGIAADARYASLTDAIQPAYYIPYTRLSSLHDLTFELRARGAPETVLGAVRQTVRGLDPNLPITELHTQAALDVSTLGSQQLLARLGGFFAVLGLLLAAIGIEGTMAYAVARRTREIGIKMALGASRRGVLGAVLRESLDIAAAGVAVGLGLALALAQFIASQLTGVAPRDPATLAGAGLVLLAVALGAGYWPARRAAQVDPAITLRSE